MSDRGAPLQRLRRELGLVGVNLRREGGKLVRKLLAPAGQRELPPEYPQDFAPFTRSLCARVGPHTMTTKERIANIEVATRHLVRHGIAGAIVECGVGAGGSMMAVALTLLDLAASDRDMWLYDTYEGMPPPTQADVSILGKPATRKYERKMRTGDGAWHRYALDLVQANLAATGYPADRLHFVKGLVQDTLPGNTIGPIAMLRLDTNLYESTCAEMEHLFPLLVPGGVFIVDDYNKWLGQRRAVDEYFERHGVRMLLNRIDDHAVQGVRP